MAIDEWILRLQGDPRVRMAELGEFMRWLARENIVASLDESTLQVTATIASLRRAYDWSEHSVTEAFDLSDEPGSVILLEALDMALRREVRFIVDMCRLLELFPEETTEFVDHFRDMLSDWHLDPEGIGGSIDISAEAMVKFSGLPQGFLASLFEAGISDGRLPILTTFEDRLAQQDEDEL